MEESIASSFSPRKLDEKQFERKLAQIRSSRVSVYSCNLFIPGFIKLCGAAHDPRAVLGYVDTVLNRCSQAGIKVVVLGSGEARKIPPGFDSIAAYKQFITIGRSIAEIAGRYRIIVAMENLNRSETNFGNTLHEVVQIAKAINHPSFRVTADVYHMLKEDEGPDAILEAGGLLAHGHIAEEKERARPGKFGEDFRPYFRAMKQSGFSGKVMMECNWKNIAEECGPALMYLQSQLNEVYGEDERKSHRME